jgi:hypothetical protein
MYKNVALGPKPSTPTKVFFFFLGLELFVSRLLSMTHVGISYVSPFSPTDNFILHCLKPLHHITLHFYFQKIIYNSKPPMLFIT